MSYEVCLIPEINFPEKECKKGETFLLDYNVDLIKRMFADEAQYQKHMGALWVLRELVSESIGVNDGAGCMNHPQYPIFELINGLIGALLRQDTHFEVNKHRVDYFRNGKGGKS